MDDGAPFIIGYLNLSWRYIRLPNASIDVDALAVATVLKYPFLATTMAT
jgi:hypothetical protein